jgi:nucleoside-diphosphate kinase
MAQLHTYAMIKPGYGRFWGKVIDRVHQEGFKIVKLKTFQFDRDLIAQFYSEHVGKEFYERMSTYLLSGTCVAIELAREDAIAKWRQVMGPTAVETAKEQAPDSLRALYARSTTENFVHGSDSPAAAQKELRLIFGD